MAPAVWAPHPVQSRDQFRRELAELAHLVGHYALDRFRPNAYEPLDRIRFESLVHEGWKKAQNRALTLVLSMTDELSEVRDEIKSLNRRRDRDAAKQMEGVEQQLIFRVNQVRHAINAIIWTIFRNEHHVLRRFLTDKSGDNLSRYNLFQAMLMIDQINASPSQVAICSDLSTCMHVGDAVVIDTAEKIPIAIAEFKSGEVNSKCMRLMEESVLRQCERFTAFSLQDLRQSEFDQLKRMVRQIERNQQIDEVLRTGRGIDHATGKPLQIDPQTTIVNDFGEKILEMSSKLEAGENYALSEVDDCLHLALYADHRLMPAFNQWMGGLGIEGVRCSYQSVARYPAARPTLSLEMPYPLVKNLYTGRWQLLMCLDVDRWLNVAAKAHGVEIVHETERATRKLRNRHNDPFIYKDRAVSLKHGSFEAQMAGGLLQKMFFDFHTPVDVVLPMVNSMKRGRFAPER